MSNINTNGIDTTFPIPGKNNSTQGFRDNFTNIKNNLDIATAELADLQSKAVVKSALSGTAINNNMNGQEISNVVVSYGRTKAKNLGSTMQGTVVINTSSSEVFYGTVTGGLTLDFGNWPKTEEFRSIRVELSLTDSNRNAVIKLPKTTINNGVITGVSPAIQRFENWFGTATEDDFENPIWDTTYEGMAECYNYISATAFDSKVVFDVSSRDCGSTIDITPVISSPRAGQLMLRTPTGVGIEGDKPGQICYDGQYVYVCVGVYNGTTHIWTRAQLAGF